MDNDAILVTRTGFSQTLNIADNPQKTGKYGSLQLKLEDAKVILKLKLEDAWLSNRIEDMLHAMTCVSLPMLNLAIDISMNLALLVHCVYNVSAVKIAFMSSTEHKQPYPRANSGFNVLLTIPRPQASRKNVNLLPTSRLYQRWQTQ